MKLIVMFAERWDNFSKGHGLQPISSTTRTVDWRAIKGSTLSMRRGQLHGAEFIERLCKYLWYHFCKHHTDLMA